MGEKDAVKRGFEIWFKRTARRADNEELRDLVDLHMGRLHKVNLDEWLKAAFIAGANTQKDGVE